jgi:D-3-phosphoglycerate dehydrogenase
VHHDQPGVIGRIGSLLGDAEVNISGMQIGLREGGREALGLLNLDTHPTPELLEQIATLPFVDSVFAVSLS